MKDEALKREVLKELENKKITKKEAKEKLENFFKTLDLNTIIEKEKIETYNFLNKEYKVKKENIYKGTIDNSKNGLDPVNVIINRIKLPLYFKNRKIKKIKKLCHENILVAQSENCKLRNSANYKSGIFFNIMPRAYPRKNTGNFLKKDTQSLKKSIIDRKKESENLKNKINDYVKNTFLKEASKEDKEYILKILNNNVLSSLNKDGILKSKTLKSTNYDIFKGYKNEDLRGGSLRDIYKNKSDFNLVIACDTEFINIVGANNKEECLLLSSQFCFYWRGYIYTFTFLMSKIYTSKLSLKTFIQHILKYIDTHLFKINNRDKQTSRIFNITLLHHFGRADLQHYTEFYKMFYKGQSFQVQGGINSIKPLRMDIHYQNRKDREELCYSINITLRDTMGYSVGEKSLARQSSEQFFKKIEDKTANKNDMLSYLIYNTKNFLDYADMDALCTLELGYKLWGFNSKYPMTIGQHAVDCYINTYLEHIMGTTIEDTKSLFKFLFNGSYKADTFTKEDEKGNLQSTDIYKHTNINISNNLNYYSNAYHGGLNQCYTRGYFAGTTYDFDLVSAYPSFMSCLPEVNMLLPHKEFYNISPAEAFELLQDKKEFNLAVAIVDFDFSSSERYKNHSCIAQKILNNLVFTSKGKNVSVCGAELYRALELGVITKIEKLIIPHYLEKNIFKDFYKKTINIRNLYKKIFGKKSIQQEIIKYINNTPYGKLAQGISLSKIISYINKIVVSEFMPICDLTNPIYASATTSLVRCYLIDTIALMEENGFIVHSVTTDGFICNATIEDLDYITQNDNFLKDFTKRVLEVAKDIQGNNKLNSLWEVKHTNNTFYNLTTRGNFSINTEGVLACAGAKILKRFKNRSTILHYLLKNKGKCNDKFLKLTTLTEMLIKEEVLCGVYIYKNNFFLEFDGKNIPILETAETVKMPIKNTSFEVLNFKTRQVEDIEEYIYFKSLLVKYKNATYEKESFFKLMQEFNTRELPADKKEKVIHSKNSEYSEAKNFIYNYLTNNLDKKIIKYLKSYTIVEMVDFINLNFLEYNNKKLTKNIYENTQKNIKKEIEAKKEIKKKYSGEIELKILEHIKTKK